MLPALVLSPMQCCPGMLGVPRVSLLQFHPPSVLGQGASLMPCPSCIGMQHPSPSCTHTLLPQPLHPAGGWVGRESSILVPCTSCNGMQGNCPSPGTALQCKSISPLCLPMGQRNHWLQCQELETQQSQALLLHRSSASSRMRPAAAEESMSAPAPQDLDPQVRPLSRHPWPPMTHKDTAHRCLHTCHVHSRHYRQ